MIDLKAIRTEKGLTQEQLAEKVQLRRQTLSNIEIGIAKPSIPTAKNWARYLSLTGQSFTKNRKGWLNAKDKPKVTSSNTSVIRDRKKQSCSLLLRYGFRQDFCRLWKCCSLAAEWTLIVCQNQNCLSKNHFADFSKYISVYDLTKQQWDGLLETIRGSDQVGIINIELVWWEKTTTII